MEERSLKNFAKQNTILRFDSSRPIFYLDWNDIFGIMLCIATIIRIIFPGKNQTGLKRSLFLIGEHIEFESSTSPKRIALSLPLFHCGERARMVGGDALFAIDTGGSLGQGCTGLSVSRHTVPRVEYNRSGSREDL